MNNTAICIYYDGNENKARQISVSPQDTIDFSDDEALRRTFSLHLVHDDIVAIIVNGVVFNEFGENILVE